MGLHQGFMFMGVKYWRFMGDYQAKGKLQYQKHWNEAARKKSKELKVL